MNINFVLNYWCLGTVLLIISIIITSISLLRAAFSKIELKKPKGWFDDASNLGDEKDRLVEHGDRIIGTLMFWKNKAALHNRLAMARTYWGISSSILIPVLVQFYNNNDIWANVFMTVLTTWTSFISILAYTLKSDEKYRGFRQCESDYYDLARELLDNPAEECEKLKKQVDEFLEIATQIRKLGRAIETDSTISIKTDRRYLSQ